MNIVFSYHEGDCGLAMKSAQAISAIGMNLRHNAFVLATKNTPMINEITQELKKSFAKVEHIQAQDGFQGWPLGPNQMFVDASSWAYDKESSWYFWEPDCVPMRSGWIDILEDDYRLDPKIMGHVYAGGMAPNGKTIYNMIVGSAVYPPNYLDFCPSARSLSNYNSAYREANAVPQPWDVRCRYNFLAIGRDTPLIRTYWNSVNYRWIGDVLVFSAKDFESQSVQQVTCPDRRVDEKALVVHGCKDGSLHDIVISKLSQTRPSSTTPNQVTKPNECSVPSEFKVWDSICKSPIEKTLEEKLEKIGHDIDVSGHAEIISEVIGKPAEKKTTILRKPRVKTTGFRKSTSAKRRYTVSPEERKRRSDKMKELLAKKREQKAASVV